MKALYNHGFPVPKPYDVNRHCVVMALGSGYQLNSIQELRHPGAVFDALMKQICRLASFGLIHCDFNEFNLLVNDEEEVTIIDFPQMVSTEHVNAQYYFDRDVECIRTFFKRRFGFEAIRVPRLFVDTERCDVELDEELRASGWDKAANEEFDKLVAIVEDVDTGEEGGPGSSDDGGVASDEQESDAEGLDEGEEAVREERTPLSIEANGNDSPLGLPESREQSGEVELEIERKICDLSCGEPGADAANRVAPSVKDEDETRSVAGSVARSQLSRLSSARRPPVTQEEISERVKRDMQKQHHRSAPKVNLSIAVLRWLMTECLKRSSMSMLPASPLLHASFSSTGCNGFH